MAVNRKIYFDYNATTPVDARVMDAMMPYFTEKFGNASSDHVFGWDAGEAIETAREEVGKMISCKPTEITFTSGATEAANIVLAGFSERNKSRGNHLVTCKTEHKAVLDILSALEKKGFDITYLDVDQTGNIDLQELENVITSNTILVCLMLSNNETGLVHPMKKIERIVHEKGVKLMSDITQAVGKIPVDLKELNLDLAIFSAHKIYGPKGVGALYINKKNQVGIDPPYFGGGQEKGVRPGTLNVPGIVGFGKAAEIISSDMETESVRIRELRQKMEDELEKIDGAIINAGKGDRLPNTTNISFKDIEGELLLRILNSFAISRGSACTSNTVKPSHVLKAMGLSDDLALSSIRISLGRNTTGEDIDLLVTEMRKAVKKLKEALV